MAEQEKRSSDASLFKRKSGVGIGAIRSGDASGKTLKRRSGRLSATTLEIRGIGYACIDYI